MREGKADQREGDRHHLGRRALRAQIVEALGQQEQEHDQAHVGRPDDRGADHRRMERDQDRREERDEQAEAARAQRVNQTATITPNSSAASSAGVGVPAGVTNSSNVVARNGIDG